MKRKTSCFVTLFLLCILIFASSASIQASAKSYTVSVGDLYKINTDYKKPSKTYKWKSSNGKIATISQYANLKGKKKGTTKITLYKGKKVIVSHKVYVKAAPSKLTISNSKISLTTGQTAKIKKTLNGKATCHIYKYESYSPGVATVSSSGTIKAISPGSATIGVSTYNGRYAECTVTVTRKADKVLCLTFDDGPVRANTTKALDLLKQYGAHATFFVVGYELSGNGDLLRRMVNEGNEIGVHTWNHYNLSTLGYSQVVNEIDSVTQVIKNTTGVAPMGIRPPGGNYNDTTLAACKDLGLPVILWSIDTRDWALPDVASIKNNILNMAHDGGIMIVHDLHAKSVEALAQALPTLVAQGYQIVDVSEFAKLKGYTLTPGGKLYGKY